MSSAPFDLTALPERFWSKVDRSGDCWLWTAFLNHHGYAQFHWKQRPRLGHRVVFEELIEPVPGGMCVDHICHVRHCVNPAHLRLTTFSGNSQNLIGAHKDSRSGIRGVVEVRPGRWQGRVMVKGQLRMTQESHNKDQVAEATRALREEMSSRPVRG